MAAQQISRDSGVASKVAPLLAFGLLYFFLCWCGQRLMLAPALGVAIWPPGGLLVATLLRVPRRLTRPLLATAMLADLAASMVLFDFPVTIGVPIAVANAVESWVGCSLLRRYAGTERFEIVNVRSALAYVSLAGFVAPLFGMMIGATAVGFHTDTPLGEAWRLWWTGDALGVLVIGPLALSFGSDAWRRFLDAGPFRNAEFALLLGVVGICSYISHAHAYPTAFITLPPIIWASLRHGVAGSSVAVGLTVVQAVLYALRGDGQFVGTLPLADTQLAVQAFGIVSAMTGLLLAGSAIHERRAKQLAEALVKVRTNELTQREVQLEQALGEMRTVDGRKDLFLSFVAHELRNPIGALRNGLALLERDVSVEVAGKTRQMMRRQCDQLVLIVDELYDLARIKSGKMRLNVALVSVHDIAQGALDSVTSLCAQKEQVLTCHLPAVDTTLHGDRGRLQQVLVNLLGNASRHCPAGTRIDLRIDATSEQLIVDVEDSGPGIPEHRLESIFGLHEQAERAPGNGLGIGLTLVRQIVELHGGSVDVKSALGKGSTFRVCLPR